LTDKVSGLILMTCFSSGKTSDLRLLQASKLSLSDTVTCSGDAGYQGMHKLFVGSKVPVKKPKKGTLTQEQKRSNREQRRERVCIEHTMRRLKVFKILSYRYRNHRKRFTLRFNLIASLLNKDWSDLLKTTNANDL